MYYLMYMLMGVGISQILLYTQRVLAKYKDTSANSMLFVLPPSCDWYLMLHVLNVWPFVALFCSFYNSTYTCFRQKFIKMLLFGI